MIWMQGGKERGMLAISSGDYAGVDSNLLLTGVVT